MPELCKLHLKRGPFDCFVSVWSEGRGDRTDAGAQGSGHLLLHVEAPAENHVEPQMGHAHCR